MTKTLNLKTLVVGGIALAVMTAFVPTAFAVAPNWDVSGTWVFDYYYGGSNLHDMTLAQDGAGVLTGTGGAFSGALPYAYPWTVIGGSSVSGDNITFIGDYDNLACTFTAVGTIAPDGTMSGTWTDDCAGPREGTWETTSGEALDISDDDGDGVLGGDDFCPVGTSEEDGDWDVSWGPNRWQVQDNGSLVWYQNKVKKGEPTATAGPGIDYTYGCNGHQILQLLQDEFGDMMNGHWKFGLSSSVLEEFHLDLSDGVLDGMYYLETVVVPASDADGVSSVGTLLGGQDYKFKAYGTANAGDNIEFDADFSFRTGSSIVWTDDVSTYEYLLDTLLDLMVDGGFVTWGDNTYHADHIYWMDFVGLGAPVDFGVYDVYYPNNTGNLTVDIYGVI